MREEPFGKVPGGAEARLFTLSHDGGLVVSITNYGGAITSLWTPDRRGNIGDVVLGYDSLAGYIAGRSFFGGIIGRFGNRIAFGRFTLDGVAHQLPTNDGPHHLHGGPTGFDRVLWDAELAHDGGGPGLRLTRTSRDGEEGYPGNLNVEVTYSLADAHTLEIRYRAESDASTPVNLTNHAYFNLGGHSAGDILGHELTIFGDAFTPVDAGLIPTGERKSVAGTPLDFREPRAVGERIDAAHPQLKFAGGYDHNFVLRDGEAPVLAARVREPRDGRVLEIFTTEPGIQFYSGNFLDGREIGKNRTRYTKRTGFCLETQHFPDSPNQPGFPSTILRPGKIYSSTTRLRFTADETAS